MMAMTKKSRVRVRLCNKYRELAVALIVSAADSLPHCHCSWRTQLLNLLMFSLAVWRFLALALTKSRCCGPHHFGWGIGMPGMPYTNSRSSCRPDNVGGGGGEAELAGTWGRLSWSEPKLVCFISWQCRRQQALSAKRWVTLCSVLRLVYLPVNRLISPQWNEPKSPLTCLS